MADYKDVVKLALDTYHGTVQNYSVGEAQDVVREALIKLNNGKSYIDIRDIRDGKCPGLFAFVEEVLAKTTVEGLQGDEFFMSIVDFKNVAEGDSPIFTVKDSNVYFVAETANGTQGVRRQRLIGETEVRIPTTVKTIRIYEELNRILAKRADFTEMIRDAANSFTKDMLNKVYALWSTITADELGGTVYYPAAGSYDEDTLLELIAHVEAASGKQATIVGTKKALRWLKESIMSDGAKEEMHKMGYVGRFWGTPCVNIPQRHKIGTTDFAIDDNVLHIVAGDDKPIKVVREGNPLVIMGNPINNVDLTQEYFYAEKYGVGIVTAGNCGIGRYDLVSNSTTDNTGGSGSDNTNP